MSQTSDPIAKLIFELSKLPGIGEKTATRLSYYILKSDIIYAEALSQAILTAKREIILCRECFNFTTRQQDPCSLCTSTHRDHTRICVVERPSDVAAIESTNAFHGTYHVLHGVLSPLEGVGPDALRIQALLERIERLQKSTPPTEESVLEVMIATNPSVEGEATALYLTRLLKALGVRVTKLAHGLPVGGTLEYVDRQTILRAMENRLEVRT